MSDLISRKEVIKAVKFYETFCDPYPRVIEALEELPSAQPDKDLIHLQKEQAYMQGYEDGKKSRKGKWRRRLVDCGFNADWHCSECGWKTSIEEHGYNFCPNCGSYNGGEQTG